MLTSWKAGFLLDGHKGTGKSQVAAHRSTRTQDLMHGVLLRGLEPARHVGTQERCGWLDCLMVFRTGERCSHAPDAGWLVVLEPTPGRYAREIAEIKRSNNGVGGQCAACKSKHTCLQAASAGLHPVRVRSAILGSVVACKPSHAGGSIPWP